MMTDEQAVWIEREMAETHKFVAEQRKLIAESQALAAQERKFQREFWWLPFTVIAGNSVIAALIGAVVGHFMK